MSEQYFAQEPSAKSRPAPCQAVFSGHTLSFMTDGGVFSRGEMDAGTRILLSALPVPMRGRILDLGCGWGAVGVCLSKAYPECYVVSSDVNTRALALCRDNYHKNGCAGEVIESDGFERIDGDFDAIVTNPPIRAGKQVIYRLFSEAASRLRPGGALYIVIRKQQGAPSALAYLKTLFYNVHVIDKSGGYWVIACGEKQ